MATEGRCLEAKGVSFDAEWYNDRLRKERASIDFYRERIETFERSLKARLLNAQYIRRQMARRGYAED